jgi:7-carboxy-7-deazaguanine synthase
MLRVFNTFTSIQGESSFCGYPCFFIRLAGCPLNCVYCDTRFASVFDGVEMSVSELVNLSIASPISLVEVTGGEPLFQSECIDLLLNLANIGKTVLLETSGAFSIISVDFRVHIVMDIKCPDSNMNNRMLFENLDLLERYNHELKFVVSSKSDFDWAIDFISSKKLNHRNIIFSPALGSVLPSDLASWILLSKINARFQLQLHKLIWPFEPVDR